MVLHSIRRFVGALVSRQSVAVLSAAVAASLTFLSPAAQAQATWVLHTGWVPYYPHSEPNGASKDTSVEPAPDGTPITVDCWVQGERIYGGSDAWFHIAAGTYEGNFIYYYFVKESTPNTIPTAIPPCPRAPTDLTAAEATLVTGLPKGRAPLTLDAALTLASDGSPMAGQLIVFTSGSTIVCSARTMTDGHATCEARSSALAITTADGYRADFAGTAIYEPSSASAGLQP